MFKKSVRIPGSVAIAVAVAAVGLAAQTQPSTKTKTKSAATAQVKPSTQATPKVAPIRYHPDRFAGRAGQYYKLVWGVDDLSVKWSESGEVIKFTYQVVDAEKAKALNDKKSEPLLIDPRAGVKLVVPSLEKIGQLRQSGTPEAGKFYWMAFSNKGRVVKRGDRVNIIIGHFKADGLVVD